MSYSPPGRDENFSNFDPIAGFGLEILQAEIKVNQNLKQRMKTIVRRKKGPAREDDLPWSWQLYVGTQNNSDKNGFRWLEMSITKSLSFNIYMESYKEKRDQKLVPLYKFMLKLFFHCINFRHLNRLRLRSRLEESCKRFRCFPRSVENRDFKIHYGGLLLRPLRQWGTRLTTPFHSQTSKRLRFRCVQHLRVFTKMDSFNFTLLIRHMLYICYICFIRQRLDQWQDFLLLCRSYISQNLDLPLSCF